MKKYWLIFKLSVQRELSFRGNFFIRFITQIIIWLVLLYLWLAIYNEGKILGDYSFKAILTYYTLITIFAIFFSKSVAWAISNDIREGELLSYLVKPLSYFGYQFFSELGQVFLSFLYVIPIFLIIFFKREWFSFDLTLARLFWLVLLLAGAYLFHFFLFYFLGAISFFSHSSSGFLFSWGLIEGFLSGWLVPLDLLPPALSQITKYLPFQFINYIPASFGVGRLDIEKILPLIPTLIIWIVIVWLLCKVAWYLGSKKYEAFGR